MKDGNSTLLDDPELILLALRESVRGPYEGSVSGEAYDKNMRT